MKHEYVTVAKAAEIKGVSRTSIYKAISRGVFRVEQVLGRTALRRKDVELWQPGQLVGRRKGTPMSNEAKRRISEGQKRRWAKRKVD